ncbi:hypothetical protein VPH35_043295 [Triticum aestivum]
MPSPLRNMPPLAAAATECRFSGKYTARREINPAKDKPWSVRLHGDLVVIYKLCEVGGPKMPRLVHEAAPKAFDQVFLLHDPETFFRSYLACREAIHQMLTQTPQLREFDLAVDNWDDFMPQNLAREIVENKCRQGTDEHMGVGLRYNVDLALTIWARAVYSEPKALLLACKEATAAQQCRRVVTTAECSVCMEDLAVEDNADAVLLPCSHAFHGRCLAPWFHRVSTCPMCRRDMAMYLPAITPKGKFPGLELEA